MKYAIQRVYTFDQLNEKAQEKAINDQVQFMLDVELDSEMVENAIQKANDNQTPWFVGKILYEENYDAIMDIVRRSYYDSAGYFIHPDMVFDLPE